MTYKIVLVVAANSLVVAAERAQTEAPARATEGSSMMVNAGDLDCSSPASAERLFDRI